MSVIEFIWFLTLVNILDFIYWVFDVYILQFEDADVQLCDVWLPAQNLQVCCDLQLFCWMSKLQQFRHCRGVGKRGLISGLTAPIITANGRSRLSKQIFAILTDRVWQVVGVSCNIIGVCYWGSGIQNVLNYISKSVDFQPHMLMDEGMRTVPRMKLIGSSPSTGMWAASVSSSLQLVLLTGLYPVYCH